MLLNPISMESTASEEHGWMDCGHHLSEVTDKQITLLIPLGGSFGEIDISVTKNIGQGGETKVPNTVKDIKGSRQIDKAIERKG